MRLIDADALYNGAMKNEYFQFKESDQTGKEAFAYSCAMERLVEAPAVDAVPVIHAHWIELYEDIMCSRCKATYYDDIVDMYHDRVDYRRYVGLEHCPHCGALMSGDDEND